MTSRLFANDQSRQFETACEILRNATDSNQVTAASIYVLDGMQAYSADFGKAMNGHASYLLGSITKPLAISAVMSLFDDGLFQLDDKIQEYLPEFTEEHFSSVTIRHLLTHTSGLPDQVDNNAELRASHASLEEFVVACRNLKFSFTPGTNYEYSSMGILLACEIAQRLSGKSIQSLVQSRVLDKLQMNDSALGVGRLSSAQRMPCQVEYGAPEAGGGDPASNEWNWNSTYWRQLGAPWGGGHASAHDIAIFLQSVMHSDGRFLKPETSRLMISNHNPDGLESRGLGFDVDLRSSGVACSANSFGHTGSTGTIAWTDLDRDLVCVVLTTLPARALPTDQHPRMMASNAIAK